MLEVAQVLQLLWSVLVCGVLMHIFPSIIMSKLSSHPLAFPCRRNWPLNKHNRLKVLPTFKSSFQLLHFEVLLKVR